MRGTVPGCATSGEPGPCVGGCASFSTKSTLPSTTATARLSLRFWARSLRCACRWSRPACCCRPRRSRPSAWRRPRHPRPCQNRWCDRGDRGGDDVLHLRLGDDVLVAQLLHLLFGQAPLGLQYGRAGLSLGVGAVSLRSGVCSEALAAGPPPVVGRKCRWDRRIIVGPELSGGRLGAEPPPGEDGGPPGRPLRSRIGRSRIPRFGSVGIVVVGGRGRIARVASRSLPGKRVVPLGQPVAELGVAASGLPAKPRSAESRWSESGPRLWARELALASDRGREWVSSPGLSHDGWRSGFGLESRGSRRPEPAPVESPEPIARPVLPDAPAAGSGCEPRRSRPCFAW